MEPAAALARCPGEPLPQYVVVNDRNPKHEGPGERLPVVFVGHGSPMNAIGDNPWSRAFRALGATLPRPRAILSISAHWYEAGTLLTAEARPRTIHDFGGFPTELYRLQYPAPGDPALAARVVQLLGEGRAALDTGWGLDHGTWSVLLHMLPAADCPVVQLSLDSRLSAAEHLALGRALAPLRTEGVLIMGSGNITHNLRQAFSSLQRGDRSTPAWGSRFDAEVQRAVEQHDAAFLTRALDSSDGRKCHPTPDHYLPLLYAFGAAENGEAVRFPITGFDLGSLSMRAVVFGWRSRKEQKMDVRNKVALITGASAGIGQATARRLAEADAKVALAARSAEALERLAKELEKAGHEALAVPTDMRSADQVKRFVEEAFRRFGRVDILVNNAGQGMAASVEKASVQDFQSLIELNVFGPVLAMQAAIPLMRRNGGGVIANVSSMVSKMHIPGLGVYAATKAALNLLSETARYELERDGIKVITVFPRTTATDFGKHSLGDQGLRQHQRSAAASSSPVDTPDYVAGRILQAIETETAEQYMDH